MKQITYPLPPKCAIQSVTLRETNGVDEAEADLSVESRRTRKDHEMVDLAIVAVNGEQVLPGVTGFREWPTKTRAVVSKFNDRINGISKKILYDCIVEAEENGTIVNDDGATEIRYPLPAGEDLGLEFVVLREMMEADERAAAIIGKNLQDEMVRRCIVSSSLGSGEMSLEAIQGLSTKTRAVIGIYFNGMNFVEDDELAPFIREAEANEKASAECSDSDSSPNGSGSPAPVDAA